MREPSGGYLLIEIGTEELPPVSLQPLAQAFLDGLRAQLESAALAFDAGSARAFATPRRLAVLLGDVAPRQPDRAMERRGPAIEAAFDAQGAPTRAALGFAKSVGAGVDDLERLETDQGAWLVHRYTQPGQTVQALIPAALEQVLAQLPIARRMRWGDREFEFVRPVHWVVALYGDAVIECEVFGIASGRETRGHRFHHGEPLPLAQAQDYEAALQGAAVAADFDKRRRAIAEQVAALARPGRPAQSDALLDEVTALTEWPAAMGCEFEARFLDLPPEVLITTLQHEQRFFPVLDEAGRVTPRFVAVANIESKHPDVVRAGFERVVRPRLDDAEFFYRQDLKTPLADRREALKGVLFQQRLGSVFDKSERIATIAVEVARRCGVDASDAERVAQLCKCDLTTLMVGEFPELQGVMGRYYAAHGGAPERIAHAIEQHYRPRYAGDAIPAHAEGRIVALADKLDTVCGVMMAAGKPSGNKDPFGLRRQAVGILRILIEGEMDLDLNDLIALARDQIALPDDPKQGAEQTLEFFMERLRGLYREQGVSADVFAAVDATGTVNVLDFDHRIQACLAFRTLPEAAALAAANKRVRNILKQAGKELSGDVEAAKLQEPAEKDLHRAMAGRAVEIAPLLERNDYQAALQALARLREPVDAFFDRVMVMSEDEGLRENRLALLASMYAMFLSIADVGRLSLGETP